MSFERAAADDDAASEELSNNDRPQATAPRGSNAFTELMKPKSKPLPKKVDNASKNTLHAGRSGLAAYITDPASFPQSRVVYYNDQFVVINDLFPKAAVHLLILPRDMEKSPLPPQEAFDDVKFLEACRREEEKVRHIAAEELRRRFGQFSTSEHARTAAYEADDLPDVLPPGRDWAKEIKSGLHANPSMSHLHIHVLSRDMVSEPMKKRNHYQSFTTDFFIGLDEFPLAEDDRRRDYRKFPEDMVCWRCGRNFRNKMARLKEHLAEEFEEWKRE